MSDPLKAFYGIKHVEKANENQAIETLLISDSLFRFVLYGTRRMTPFSDWRFEALPSYSDKNL